MSDADNPNLEVAAPVQPDGKRGGPDFHKPGCRCNACVARRRKAEAIARRPGAADAAITPTDAVQSSEVLTDLPIVGSDVMRHRVKMWLQWKALEPGITQAEAAKRLGIAPQTLTNTICKASKEGWLQFQNPLEELEYRILPKVTNVLVNALDNGDTDVAIKTAQATIFKQFLDTKGVKDVPNTILALKIEMPPGFDSTATPNIKGVIVGTPRTIDGDFVALKKDE